ncbi:hypothetical protein F5Y09DRAFT_322101 [Xylaria sp. FL1042]|nr:hypothetical protein F5Y09DRAFT_322101 [Xylaria sp. FL1042]
MSYRRASSSIAVLCEGANKLTPIVAYVDHDHIVHLRRMKFSRMYGIEDPGLRLARIRLKSYNLAESLQDPYLVAVLIAFAQKQRRALRLAMLEQVAGVCPKLLRTSGNTDLIHLYSTNMSFTFLSMFDDPAVPPPMPQSLSIQITAIPCKPLNTLRDRIMAQVLSVTTPEEVGGSDHSIVFK